MTRPPVERTTSWPYEDGEPGAFVYSRFGHPTQAAAEAALGALEGGHALLFPSGTGAGTALLLGLLDTGATVAVAHEAYYGTLVLMTELERWGLEHVEFDQAGPPPDGADLVWIEAPSNPFLTMPDFEAAAAHPAPVVCDATASTPVYLRALERGCDVVLHSATKYLAGHHDCLLGALVLRREEDAERLRTFRTRTGIVAGPDEAWLLERGLETLELRVERATAAAVDLADRLRAHPAVVTVRYPGFGGLLSFDVPDGEAARRAETATQVWVNATSLGGTRSRIESRHRWEGDRCPPGLLRLSVGLEPVDELWADLESALERASA
jgi:cystathionine gamma-synthase